MNNKKLNWEGDVKTYIEITLGRYDDIDEEMKTYREYKIINITYSDSDKLHHIWLELKPEDERFVDGI